MKLREMFGQLRELLEELTSLLKQGRLADKGFLTIKNAAKYSDLSEETVRRLLSSGKLTALRPVKGRILVDRLELEAYIRTCTSTPRTGRGRHSSN